MRDCHSQPAGFFGRWFKRRTLRKQVGAVRKDLIRRYGKKRVYSTNEVRSVWRDRGYAPDYMCYAMAAYSPPADFHEYHERAGEPCDYQSMRAEVAEVCFNGHSDFTILDVVGAAGSSHDEGSGWLSDMFSGGDSCDSGGDGGGDGGGD